MSKPLMVAAILGALALPAVAETVAPDAVKYSDGAVGASLTGTAGDAVEGRDIVGSKKKGNCVACHQVSALDDIPWHGEVGPSLDGAADRWTEAELRGIVANAKMMFDGTVMPSFYKDKGYIRPGDAYTGNAATELTPILTAQQIEDIVAFLATLKE